MSSMLRAGHGAVRTGYSRSPSRPRSPLTSQWRLRRDEDTMAESTLIKFTYKELAELMVKKQGIKEGHWAVYLRFGIVGANTGPTEDAAVPTAVVPVLEIGLQRVEV